MRNGDYFPTRLEAQQDAANMLVGAKTQSHPESTVGVSAGTELLVSPTAEVGKILRAVREGCQSSSLSRWGYGSGGSGSSTMNAGAVNTTSGTGDDITAAVQVASLALKHRRNKNGSQRIILFVGTPLGQVDAKALQKAGKLLKKNNVAIDVVAMGELTENESKLKALVDAANGQQTSTASAGDGQDDSYHDANMERTCHLVTVPPGVLPSDVLANSPILAADGGAYAARVGAVAASGFSGDSNAFADFGGVDPNMDPELAMALRISMEEERARQERAAAAATTTAAASDNTGGANTGSGPLDAANMNMMMDTGLSEEDALLQRALEMSMQDADPPAGGIINHGTQENNAAVAQMTETTTGTAAAAVTKPPPATLMETDDDDDAAMQMALQMSMQTELQQEEEGNTRSQQQQQQQFQDPTFVSNLLGSMPGVDPNDPEIQEALRKALAKKDEDESNDSKKPK